MSEYKVQAVQIRDLIKAPNSDNLFLTNFNGNQVVVGKETQVGDLGIYFDTDGKLSEEFCISNELYPIYDKEGKRIGGGFIDPKNRRIRAQKFRQNRSDGFFMPLKSLKYTGFDLSKIKIGDTFFELNGHVIAEKYVSQATLRQQQNRNYKKQPKSKCFHKHFDTEQIRFYYDKLKIGDKLVCTLKCHGTSSRIGYCVEDIEYTGFKKLINKIYPIFPKEKWTYLRGSRNVILGKSDKTDFHGDDFREKVALPFIGKLRRGEVVYYEVVGYERPGKPIMPCCDTSLMKDKEFTKQYGKNMVFKYGCMDDNFDIYVYRIALVSPDGFMMDYLWEDVKTRCQELGVKHVIELEKPFIYDGNVEKLKELIEKYSDGPDLIDSSHVREGCVIRIDKNIRPEFYKNKGFSFKILEGIIKSDENYIDLEESN